MYVYSYNFIFINSTTDVFFIIMYDVKEKNDGIAELFLQVDHGKVRICSR